MRHTLCGMKRFWNEKRGGWLVFIQHWDFFTSIVTFFLIWNTIRAKILSHRLCVTDPARRHMRRDWPLNCWNLRHETCDGLWCEWIIDRQWSLALEIKMYAMQHIGNRINMYFKTCTSADARQTRLYLLCEIDGGINGTSENITMHALIRANKTLGWVMRPQCGSAVLRRRLNITWRSY